MMRDVTEQQRLLAARTDPDAQMAGTVTRRRHGADLVRRLMLVRNKIGKAGIDNRLDGVGKDRLLFSAFFKAVPEIIFGLAEEIARLREGRHPLPADKPGIPADVIDMEMR